MNRLELAKYIDHTLLTPEATKSQIEQFIADAVDLHTYSVCISPSMLPVNVPSGLRVATVCGFPSGAHLTHAKIFEAVLAVERGADEIDMVINLASAKQHAYAAVESEIRAVREACSSSALLKVIIETAALTDDEIVACSIAARDAGANFVKTSTGFHPAGGATQHAVHLIAQTVGGSVGIKASGGIRDLRTAQALIDAGATRLGMSASRRILAELPD